MTMSPALAPCFELPDARWSFESHKALEVPIIGRGLARRPRSWQYGRGRPTRAALRRARIRVLLVALEALAGRTDGGSAASGLGRPRRLTDASTRQEE